MISNGSLLTGDILDKLTEFQCRHIQITLDGIEETHNKRRISKNGEPTFHQIVENLLLLDKYYLKIPLCGGGCVMNSVKSTGSYHSSGCFKVKGVVEQQVLYLVEKKKQLSASNPITVSN